MNTLKLKWAFGLLMALAFAGAMPRPALSQAPAADPYAAIAHREFGTATDEMAAIEKEAESAKPDQYPAIENRLIAVLQTPDATKPGKQFACQMLRIVGSPRCIPVVATLLPDEDLSQAARYVLLPLHDPAVDTALRQALRQTQGKVQLGIINTIGDRRDRGALDALGSLVKSGDNEQSLAALNAIGKIGGAPAARTLERSKPDAALTGAWSQAYLRSATSMAAAGDTGHSEKMLRSLLDGPYPSATRAGALLAYVQSAKERATPQVITSLGSDDMRLKQAAVAAVISAPGHPATVAFARQLSTLPADQKVTLLQALAERGDAEGVTGSINGLVSDADPTVRDGAVRALGRLGDASSVPVLAAAFKDNALAGDAARSLTALSGAGVAQSLFQQAAGGDATVRSAVIGVLAQRGQTDALPTLRAAAVDTDPKVRVAGLNALGTLGTQEDLQRLSQAMLTEKDDGAQEATTNALSAIAGRLPDRDSRVDPILSALQTATPATKIQLLSVLSTLGGDKALGAERTALGEAGDVHTAALRQMAEWPDASPLADLKAAAKAEPDKTNRILALRGYIRMIGLPGQTADSQVQAYQDAMALAERPDEKRMALAGLAGVSQVNSLQAVEPYLDNADLKNEAYQAYEKIGEGLAGHDRPAARTALQRVADNSGNADLSQKAKAAMDKIK
ncbi:MAG: HEAT repeat domain-containing protein [Armatimonadota bacterium]|nr:HEAT repeat domain-containing protein [Armatimonadota bacterium]